jgi:hypothetical protein
MEPQEIFELIVKADEKLKYATSGREDVRRQQARALLEQARDAASAIGNDALVRQAELRLADLGEDEPPGRTGAQTGRAAPTKCSQYTGTTETTLPVCGEWIMLPPPT